jgi:hypothetical protein
MNIKRSLSLGLAVAVIAAVFSVGTITSAQTSPVACTTNHNNVGINTPVIVTATGGDGTYSFVGGTTSSTGTSGNQFTASYASPGTYPVTVTSGSSSATCNVIVTGQFPTTTTPTGGTTTVVTSPLTCTPAAQSVNINNTAAFTATGGDGNYVWSGQNLNIMNAVGTGFQVSYPSAGTRVISVSSAGQTTSCSLNVVDPNAGLFPIIPTFPNTGEKYGA